MSLPPSLYCYSSLPEGSIRLLRLLPHQDEHALIQCQLFEFALVDSRSTRPYEALSYVWGSETKPRSLSIDSCDLPVGENLYAALSHLRDCSLERIIWVDAICINQRDIKEKGTQVQSMAEIYAKASDVIVWLGEATPDSCQALEEIRVAAEQRTTLSIDESAILRLLERPWFQRIWVLQEVAAARHVLIKCGPTEIDGYAFCSGLSALDLSYETSPDLEPLIRSVAYLIRGAVFRSRGATSRSGRFSLDICSLGELVDMYHTRKATMRHDKVFALFGMSSDDPSIAGLSVNYEISWKQLFQQLVNFVFSERASVDTWDDKEMAVIRGKGCVLGRVSSVERDVDREDRQHMWITWTNEFDYGEPNSPWTFQAPAKSVQVGDAICLLQGASMPTIIRPRNDYWVVVMIAIPPPDDLQAASRDTESELLRLITTFPHDFLLVWDWDMYPDESQDIEDYKHFIGAHMSQYPKVELEDHLDKVLRLRDTGVALQDMGRYEEATENFGKAMDIFEGVVRNMDCLKLACPGHGSWRKGDVEKLEGMVGLLIKDKGGWMPLCFAAESGLETMVKLSLSTSEVDLNAEAGRNRTPLLLAVKNGHEAIVKILLDTDKVDVNATDIYGETPLSVAAENGHEAIVKLLLGTDKVDLETPDEFRRTVLSQAARKGQEAIVKLLLDTDKVDLNATDIYERMPLSVAAEKGHEGIIKLLLSTGKVNPNATDWSGQTALSLAAANGQEAIVKMLLGSDKVDPDAQDRHRRTPFWWAAENGHEAIVKMLIGHGKVDLDIKAGLFSRTPLSVAAEKGHEGVAKLLLSTGKADPDAQGSDRRTPFWFAAEYGHEAIVKMLIKHGKVDLDIKAGPFSRTPLLVAAKEGHEGIAKLLLSTGKVDPDAQGTDGRTPFWFAADNGHEGIVKLLRSA